MLIFHRNNVLRAPVTGIRCDKWLNIILLLTLVFTFSFKTPSEKQVYSLLSNNKILVDGMLDDWDSQGLIRLKGEKAKSENQVGFMSRWDKNMLYLSFSVSDNDLRAFQTRQDDSRLYLDDMVEVLLDTNNDKDSCWNSDDIIYHINLLGVKKDDRGTTGCLSDPAWNGSAKYKVKLQGTLNDSTDVDYGYSVEIGILWTELGIVPRKGMKLGINFANGDNDGKGRQLFDWVNAWPMRSPYAFGTLILKGEIRK